MFRNFGENRRQSGVNVGQERNSGINGNFPWRFRKKKISLIYFLDFLKALYVLCTLRWSWLIQLITAFHVKARWRYPGGTCTPPQRCPEKLFDQTKQCGVPTIVVVVVVLQTSNIPVSCHLSPVTFKSNYYNK